MNKVFHYYYSKKGINSISSRGVGSSSGIIKLSGNYNSLNLETTIKKNLHSSNNNLNNNNSSSIKDESNKFTTKNQNLIKYTKNNITTLPETNNNQNQIFNQNNQNIFFNMNNTNSTPKEINFDFYKIKDNSNQENKSPNVNKMKKNSTINKNENFIKSDLTTNSRNNTENNFGSIKNINILTKKNTVDLYKKSLSSNISSGYLNKNSYNNSINKTSDVKNRYVKKLSELNSSTENKTEKLHTVYNKKTTTRNNSPKSSAINKTITSALKNSATYNSQEYLICIIENYAREVGISAYNYRTSEYFITQYIDTENYINTLTMINYWRPIEIVMNQKSEDSSLFKIIHKTFKNAYIGFLPRNKFNMDYGKEIYMKSNIRELSLIDLNTKYVCMASLSGLFNYLETNPDYYITDSYNIHFHYLESHLNISFNTTLDLELLMNRKNNKTYGSLFSLFTCKTIGGWRLLRSNILQPFTKENQIRERQDKIEELKQNPDLYSFIRDSLFCFREIEIYITKLLQSTDNKNEKDDKCFSIKNKLDAIKGIKDILCFIPNYVRFLKSYQNSKLNNLNGDESSQINENSISNNAGSNSFTTNIKQQSSINQDTNVINTSNTNDNKFIVNNNTNNIISNENNNLKFLSEIISFFTQNEFTEMFQRIDDLICNETDMETEQYLGQNSQAQENGIGDIPQKNLKKNDITFSGFIAGMKNKKKKANLYNFQGSEIYGLLKKNDEILFLVRKGENNILDMTRKTFLDTLSQVKEEFEIIKSEIGDPRMKLFYNEKKRFYISIDKKYFKTDDFIVTRKRGNKYFCTNGPLESLGNRITDLKNDIINISYKLLENLINYLKSNITLLYSLSGFIANLDIICAFTEYAINNLICSKPLINEISKNIPYIYGKNCCHPLLNKIHIYKGNNNENGDNYQQDNIVPNDYFFINQFNILLLKGPNASGKTTYMKQLALLIIMAQIGSFVPCAYFSFNCRKFLYSNFNINSITKDLSNNQEYYNNKGNIKGSFIKQITEIHGIINNKNYSKSLILLDEPFENTHSQLMMEIVISLLDLFSKNLSSSFAIISSHNDLVNRLSSFYFHSILGTMKVELNNDKNDFEFLYKFKFTPQYSYEIKQGEKEMENYGINLSRMIGMKPQIISYAEEIAENYRENSFDEFVKTSIEMNVMKTFLVKLYKNLFEIIGEKKNYTIKEQIMISIKNLYDFIDNAFK